MIRKSVFLVVAIALLIAGSAFAAVAQDGSGDDPTPFGPGWMHGGNSGSSMMHGHGMMGMMGSGFGHHMMDDDGESMMLVVAGALGLEADAFYAALHDGQTLTEIAEAQGVEIQSVYDAMLTHAEEHMAASVAAGNITQEQADEHLTWMRENIAEMPMFSGVGFGFCMGHGGSSSMGMMGRGHGMQ